MFIANEAVYFLRFQPIEGDRLWVVFRAKFSKNKVYPRTGQEGPEG
jgi:hypothetical protein